MRDHAIVSPRFWTGKTGLFLREYPDAQRLAMYLITCPSSNMIGLYYLPIPVICHELQSPFEGVKEAIQKVEEGGFARYDSDSETIFVRKMAYFQIASYLKRTDNRVKGVEKMLLQYRNSKFFMDFIQEYKEPFHLNEKRLLFGYEPPSKPLERGFSQEQEQDQEQDQEKGAAKPPSRKAVLSLPESLDKPNFKTAWESWLAYRRERKLTMTERTIKGQIAFCEKVGIPAAIEAIEIAIRSGWQGIFQRDDEKKKTGNLEDAVNNAFVWAEEGGEKHDQD